MTKNSLRIVLIGWGAINSRVASLLKERGANVQIVAIATRNAAKPSRIVRADVAQIDRPEDLMALEPDLVVEAASKAAVELWAPIALEAARNVIILSTSAFVDGELLGRLRDRADRYGSRLIIPTGAIGGIDALASAALLPLDEVTHRISKPPEAWRGTNAETMCDLLSLSAPTIFFKGSAREAAKAFPQNANATVVTALAGLGLEQTIVELVADPLIRRNQHTIAAAGRFGRINITLENEPSQDNPKSSELTALNLTRLIEEQVDRVVIGK